MLETAGFENEADSGGGDSSTCLKFPETKQDPMRVWQEMKRNGFVTPSFGQIPSPKEQSQQQRKRNRSGGVVAPAKAESHVESSNLFTPRSDPSAAVAVPQLDNVEKSRVRDEFGDSTTSPSTYGVNVQAGHVKKGRIRDQVKPETMSCIETVVMPTEGTQCCRGYKKVKEPKVAQENRFMKIAAPSGLLDELNPGIINRVRNSQQVFSVIKALVKREQIGDFDVESKQAVIE